VKEFYFLPRLHDRPTQYMISTSTSTPQAAYPTRPSFTTNRAARPSGARVRADRHPESSTTTATSTCFVEFAKAFARGPWLIQIDGPQPRAGGRRRCSCLPTIWFPQLCLVVGAADVPRPAPVTHRQWAASRAFHPVLGLERRVLR
jgi:hypothetical protein